MAYTPQTWTNTTGVTSGGLTATNEANAERMNVLEAGVQAAAAVADAADTFTPTMANAAAGTTFSRVCASGVWPTRGSTRTDILVLWISKSASDPAPPIGGAYKVGDDVYLKVT